MKKHIPLKLAVVLQFVWFFSSCTTTNARKEKISIVNPPIVNPSPSVIPSQTAPIATANDKDLKDYLEILSDIEGQFLAQNCAEVLSKARKLETLNKSIHLNTLPPLAQAAIFICDARAGMETPERVQKAIAIIQKLPMRYPVIHEAWIHNMLSDFYFSLGDKQNALTEKRLARDLILAQQQDISSLNAQILQINPSEPGLSNQNNNDSSNTNLNQDQLAATASQLLNNDSPEQAIALIDSIPPNQRNENLKRIRSAAINTLVMNLRYKVRALFVRSTQQTGTARKETLEQSEQILKGIIKNYPEYSDMAAVQNNLKQVQRELAKP